MDRRRLLLRLSRGDMHSVAFKDIVDLAEGFGFQVARVRGSHHIVNHPGIHEMVNLQQLGGEAKPYQVRQFLRLVERYNLRG